jgi:hypothetical protein
VFLVEKGKKEIRAVKGKLGCKGKLDCQVILVQLGPKETMVHLDCQESLDCKVLLVSQDQLV